MYKEQNMNINVILLAAQKDTDLDFLWKEFDTLIQFETYILMLHMNTTISEQFEPIQDFIQQIKFLWAFPAVLGVPELIQTPMMSNECL